MFRSLFPEISPLFDPWGALGGVLGGSGAVLGRSWADMKSDRIFDDFLTRFRSPKGCPKGGLLRAEMVPKSIPKRGRN